MQPLESTAPVSMPSLRFQQAVQRKRNAMQIHEKPSRLGAPNQSDHVIFLFLARFSWAPSFSWTPSNCSAWVSEGIGVVNIAPFVRLARPVPEARQPSACSFGSYFGNTAHDPSRLNRLRGEVNAAPSSPMTHTAGMLTGWAKNASWIGNGN